MGMTKKTRAICGRGKILTRAEPYIWLIPSMLFLALFVFLPFIKTIVNSFFKMDVNSNILAYVGLENYSKVFKARDFGKALVNTLKFTVFAVPLSLLISTSLALAADKKRRLHKVYFVLFALPMAVSMSATCLMFQYLLNNQIGLFNYLLGLNIQWFKDKQYSIYALAFLTVWLNIGFQFIFLTSALRNLSTELIEASEIEGANAFQRTVKITLPLISPTLFYLFCISAVGSIMTFTQINIITQGGPAGHTLTLMYLLYRYAFANMQWGQAYALAAIIFLVTSATMFASFAFEKKGVFYQ